MKDLVILTKFRSTVSAVTNHSKDPTWVGEMAQHTNVLFALVKEPSSDYRIYI